ncbi:DUF6640 family protein [Sciscionella sediminilitoris]|uniref:DUF6640 family protein n=1 Tax=Sciscionella sediminilitoris TaxID=1445613 RepID=UPI0004DF3E82|nr:DUF6640 family protein [Sciscionella sp. SE31]
MSLPRILIVLVAVITMVSTVLADLVVPDLAAQHAFNPGWPPHAKFHDAQYMVMTALLGVIALVLVLRRSGNTRGRLLCAIGILAVPWLGMLGALLFPGTATYDPEFAGRTLFILGVHGQICLATVLLVVLFLAAAGTRRTIPGDRQS